MIDKQSILEGADLLTLAGGSLKRVASTNGGEYAGACPFCGGVDRFRVQPHARPWGLWMCRGCTGGKWGNAIDLVIRMESCDFKAACARLSGGELAMYGAPTTLERRPPPPRPAYAAPHENDWQTRARQMIESSQENLWRAPGRPALEYLHSRGLLDDTIRFYSLGYSSERGIIIPGMAGGEIWYLKIAFLPGQQVWCNFGKVLVEARKACPNCGKEHKYTQLKGSRPAALFGADNLVGARIGIFVEGEFDAMILDQEISLEIHQAEILGVATLGSATNRPDLATWGPYLIGLDAILAVYDCDEAGQSGAEELAELSERVKICILPEGVKDVNDFFLKGGDLAGWLEEQLHRLGLVPMQAGEQHEQSSGVEICTSGSPTEIHAPRSSAGLHA